MGAKGAPGAALAIVGGAGVAALLVSGALMLLIGAPAESAASVIVATWAITGLVAAALGLPWHALAVNRGWTWWACYTFPAAGAGGLLAITVFVVLFSHALGGEQTAPLALFGAMPIGILLGGLTGLFAWLIRRPDREQIGST